MTLRHEIWMKQMDIGYSIDKMPEGGEAKVMHIIFTDMNGETFHLPVAEEVFPFVHDNLNFHFKKFKSWLKTGKLKPMKKEKEKLPRRPEQLEYYQ